MSNRGNRLADEATALVHTGKIYRWLSQYEQAIEQFRLAVRNYREMKDAAGEADTLVLLGEVFAWLGDFRTATHYNKDALSTYKSVGNLYKQIETLGALAETTWRLGEDWTEDVSKYLTEAENLHKSIIDAAKIDPAIWQKRTAMMRDHYEEEDIRFARDFQSKQKLGLSLAAVAEVHRVIRVSQQFFTQWEKTVPSLGPAYLSAIGTLYQKWGLMLLSSGETKQALDLLFLAQLFHTSTPLNRDSAVEWAKDWFFTAEAYRRLGSLELALVYFDMATFIAFELKTPEVHWVFAGAARTLADMGRTDDAVAAYKVGLEIFESILRMQETEEVKTDVLAGASYVYRDFVALLLKIYKQTGQARYLQEAFQYNEAGRARAFLAMFGKRATKSR